VALTFVHTADWQLGKSFGFLPDDQGVVLQRARDEIVERVAGIAHQAGAPLAVVAGDVFDGEDPPEVRVRQILTRLAGAAPLTWHLLPGNHDPARAGGIWDTVRRIGVPANVHLHLTPSTAEIVPGYHLLPAPLVAKSSSSDPTLWMDAAATPEGHVRVGLAHGSIQGFGSLGEASVYIDPARARRAGLAYLALGDWHGLKEIAPSTWYSGTPEPDSFADNDPGHVLVVTLDGGPARVTPVASGQFRWLSREIKAERLTDLARLEADIAATPDTVRNWLVELRLTGRLPASALGNIEARLQVLSGRLFALRTDRRGLRLGTSQDDIGALGSAFARQIAERLKPVIDGADETAARRASRALELLIAIDGELSERQAT